MQNETPPLPPLPEKQVWQLLEKTLTAGIVEQRRTRRWGIFFKLLTFLYIFVFVGIMLLPMLADRSNPLQSNSAFHTALVELKGTIKDDSDASADRLITALRKAFENKKTKAIILRINSGGGSPVQSGYVYDEIKRLRQKYPQTKVYAVITDIGASGAYYIAAAADEIYADKASLVGSIGVTAATFGFVDTIEKLGIERRIYTSGEHKAFLDPFQPRKEAETAFWQDVLQQVHQQFIDVVKAGRGERLKVDEYPDLFSGLIWNGEQALQMGLIDGLGSSSYIARELIKAPKIVNFTVRDTPLDRFAKKLGTSAGERIQANFNPDGLQLQ